MHDEIYSALGGTYIPHDLTLYTFMVTKLQERTFDLMLQTGMPASQAMKKAGYKASTARTPQKLTNSNSWRELLERRLPHDATFKRLKYLLERKDGLSVARGLDMVFKLKGMYQQDLKIDNAVIVLPTELVDKYNLSDGTVRNASVDGGNAMNGDGGTDDGSAGTRGNVIDI